MRGDPESDALDAERARLIGSIYEVVLRPEHYDAFMEDWSDFVDQAARRLGELRISDTSSTRQLEDPVIEAHFRRAFALFERMGRGETIVPGASAADPPLVRIAREGTVSFAGPEAAEIFGSPVTLDAIRDALEPDSAARLKGFLSAFSRAPSSGRFAVLSLAESGSEATASLPGGGLVSITSLRDPEGDGFVTELRTMNVGWTPALARVLVESFRLTPREVDLVHELTRGGDLPAVSQRTGRSLNTLRAQLKSVFSKTRTGSQPELMRLVGAVMLHGPDHENQVDTPAGDGGGDERLIELGEGRKMPVMVLGPEDGLPVVFVHGMLEGLGCLRHVEPALYQAGIRLYAPMRANFGNSYVDPRVHDAPDLFARDLARVLQVLDLPRVVVLGHMAGAIYAYAAAARLGASVAGIAGVAACVPIVSIEQFATMTPRQRAVAYTARFAPALLPAVLRAGMAQIDSSSPQRFMTPLYSRGSRDREVIERSHIGQSILEGYRYTVAQGQKAFQIDAWHVTRDWSALVVGSDCPVLLIHGVMDPVVSFDSVRVFAQRYGRMHLEEIDHEGQLLLYSQPEKVVARIAAFARKCLTGED
ncbi:alpha/beta fold hydrolase [Pararhodobacter marinus]|uniref:alpha/beta fold hydrolase n=1 Tax=Pararhodobacter marinus TaxID=2184063 RepID=UPI0035151120